MSMVHAVAVLAPWLLSAGAAPDAGQANPLAVASRLLGRWVADADPQAPGVTGWSTFEREAQGRVIVRKNHAEYPAANDRPASAHDDLMVIYTEQGKVKADYLDNEEHVIRYVVTAPTGSTLVFLSEEGAPGPRFRLTYTWPSKDALKLLFEIAPPGTPEQFKPYIRASLHRG